MADINIAYGADTSVTVSSLDSLANTSSATSNAVDNSVDLFVDSIVEVDLTGASASNDDQVKVFLKQAIDGTNFDDDENDRLVEAVQMNGTSQVSKRFSLAAANGGVMPRHWQLRFLNDSGDALAASGNTLSHRGVEYTVA